MADDTKYFRVRRTFFVTGWVTVAAKDMDEAAKKIKKNMGHFQGDSEELIKTKWETFEEQKNEKVQVGFTI